MSENAIGIRRKVLRLVEKFPGLHLRDLARRAGLSEALAGYHMEALEKERLIESRFDAFYRRFYAVHAPAPSEIDQALVGILRQRVAAQVAVNLLEASPASHTDLAKKLGLAKSTFSYHVSKLEGAGLLVVAPDGIRLKEPDRVRRLLLTWRPPADVTERFSELWRRLYRSAK